MGLDIKGQKDGFAIIIDSEEDFVSAREKIIKKFDESSKFFKGAKFTKIEANHLNEMDKKYLKEMIVQNYNVVFDDMTEPKEAMKEDKKPSFDREKTSMNEKISSFDETLNKILAITKSETIRQNDEDEDDNNLKTKFVFENMRSGSEIKYAGNVIVFGDVNPGAKISAKGNVMIMGTCRGTIHAGVDNKEECFVSALKLLPLQIKINHLLVLPPEDAEIIDNAMIRIEHNEIKIEQF